MAAGLLTGLVAMAGATQAQAQPLQPDGQWEVNFGERACVAARKFRDADEDAVTVFFKPAAHLRSMEVVSIVDGYRRDAQGGKGSVQFAGQRHDAKLIRYGDRESDSVVTRFTVPLRAEDLSEASEMVLDTEWDRLSMPLSRIDEVSGLLADCVEKLRILYNVDGSGLTDGPRGGADGAKGDVRSLFRSTDYPSRSMRAGVGGMARAFLLIDEEGKAVDCSLSAYGGDPLILAQTCAILLERARFEPATDANCFPTRGSYFTPTITWRMQGKGDTGQAEFDEMEAIYATPVDDLIDRSELTPLEE
ncbi:hypothetical protein WJT74_02295 [Sphingomicrobium sp. XHP0239]|uniref:hypothetical protein n=1 Tax=Sphingomicrobium maritimum TaxID=3133972 RepID=UPI0031CCBFD4